MTAPDKIWAYSYDVNTSQGPLDVWKTINTWSDATVQPITATEYTRTDLAQAAVAAAYEAAAQVCANHAVIAARTNQDQANSLLRSSEAGIRALATPDQIAALAAERAATVTVNPLVWEKHPMGWIAAPPTGQAYIIDIRVKGRVMFIKGMNPSPQCSNIEAAKAAAQADYDARIRAAITITSAEADARVEAAVLAEREAIAAFVETHAYTVGTERKMEPSKQAINDMHHATIAAAIRSRGVTG